MSRTHSDPPHDHRHLLGIGATRFLNDFDDYLIRLKGLAPGTRKTYCFWVSRFLAAFCGAATPNWSSLRGSDLSTFVQHEASRLKRNGRDALEMAREKVAQQVSKINPHRRDASGVLLPS